MAEERAAAASARARTGLCQHPDGCERPALQGDLLCAGHVIVDATLAVPMQRLRSVS